MENSHTHEVWINKKSFDVDNVTVFTGDYKECFKYVDDLAKETGCGAGLLLINGNYDIMELAAVAKGKMRDAAPEMLATLLFYQAGIENFYNCIDFGNSKLNAEAISFMNEIGTSVNAAIKSAQ